MQLLLKTSVCENLVGKSPCIGKTYNICLPAIYSDLQRKSVPWFAELVVLDLGYCSDLLTYRSLILFSSCRGHISWFSSFGGSRAGLVHSEVVFAVLAYTEVV